MAATEREISPIDLAKMIDHTCLKPDATMYDIDRLCHEAEQFGFHSVCVNPYWIFHCVKNLENSRVKICSVVGFPLGANDAYIKAEEAMMAIKLGAREIDMVINIGKLKMSNPGPVLNEIRLVRTAVSNAILKVIIETCLLTNWEKELTCRVAQEAGADFVKTSTGFSKSGATIEDVALMRKTVGDTMGVKASGGIKDLPTALAMIEAGANRLGTSNGVLIMNQAEQLWS